MDEKVERQGDPERCPWAIHYGSRLETRCLKPDDGHQQHEARGLEQYDYQRIVWFEADRRSFRSSREDAHSWEGAYALPEYAANHSVRWVGRDGKPTEAPH